MSNSAKLLTANRKLKCKKKKQMFWMGLIKNSQTSLKSVIRNHKSLFAFSPVLGDPGINFNTFGIVSEFIQSNSSVFHKNFYICTIILLSDS